MKTKSQTIGKENKTNKKEQTVEERLLVFVQMHFGCK